VPTSVASSVTAAISAVLSDPQVGSALPTARPLS
jgi:hypothetical protein